MATEDWWKWPDGRKIPNDYWTKEKVSTMKANLTATAEAAMVCALESREHCPSRKLSRIAENEAHLLALKTHIRDAPFHKPDEMPVIMEF